MGITLGRLENWVRLQNETLPSGGGREGQAPPLQAAGHVTEKSGHGSAVPLRGGEKAYECFYFIADWHALTSDYADTSGVAQNTIEIMTDYLASGLDPAKSVIFQQSLVPEHAELHLLLSMVTPLSWLERVPTYKEALEQVKDKDLHNYGFLGYPCLQTADIVIYSEPAAQGLYVPVGEDQVSHVELSREIVRKFNFHTVRNPRYDQRGLSAPGNEELLERVMSRLLRPEELDRFFTPSQRFNLLEPAAQMRAREVGPANFIREMRPAVEVYSS